MYNRYYPSSKSGPHVQAGPGDPSARNMVFGTDHNVRWKRCRKKTARELLEKEEETPGTFTKVQRLTLEALAGKKPGTAKRSKKPVDPFDKLQGETPEEYVKRITVLVQGK